MKFREGLTQMNKDSKRKMAMKSVNRLGAVLVCSIAFIFTSAIHTQAQVVPGTPSHGSCAGGPDVVDLANMNDHWNFGIVGRAGRVMPFHYALSYDSSIWTVGTVNGQAAWQPVNNTFGWSLQTGALSGYVTYTARTVYVSGYGGQQVVCGTGYSNWVYHDPTGTTHSFSNLSGVVNSSWNCFGTAIYSTSGAADDGSGYQIAVNATPYAIIYPPGGGSVVPPLQDPNATGTFIVTDNNGNFISTTNNGSQTSFTDTLGTTALTISNNSPTTYTYTAP